MKNNMPRPKKKKKSDLIYLQIQAKTWDYWYDEKNIYVLFEMKIGDKYQMFLSEEKYENNDK